MLKKYVFIGGKEIGYECLKILLKKDLTPQLVISNSDDTGIDTWHKSLVKLCRKNRLKVVNGTRLKEKIILSEIKKIKPEIIFCIGSTQLIPDSILQVPKTGTINIHPALLPKYRGRFSTVHAIFNGDKVTGATLHWMNNDMDAGPIISSKKIKISKNDTAKTLYEKFTKTGVILFRAFLKSLIEEEKIISRKQNETEATYFPKGLPNNGEIDWNWNGNKIYNFIRAMTFEPFTPASFMLGRKKMVIVEEKYFKGYKKS